MECNYIPWSLIAFFILAVLCLFVIGRRKQYTYYRSP